jgi:signal peptide peptidase SppA
MLPPELCGPWACAEEPLRSIVAGVPTAAAVSRLSGRGGFERFNDVAIIHLAGPLTKAGGWWFSGTSSVQARGEISAAAADPDVGKIALLIDSPGGTVAGTYELAAAVAAAAKQKRTVAYIQDLGASAAYWAASQASEVFASPTAYVGSIGTYGVLVDSSGMADRMGIKVHVVRAGEFKGMGMPGTAIEKKHLEEAQRLISAQNEFFLEGVAGGRRLPLAKVRELADGRAHIAAKAKELGLIDGVQSFTQTLARLAVTGSGHAPQTKAAGPTTKGMTTMSDSSETYYGDPIADFESAVQAEMVRTKCDHRTAHYRVCQQKPELRKAMVSAFNERARQHRGR